LGDNKIKATPELLHVEGVKPSTFLSTTRQEAGTVNPSGESFGARLYEIDLAYISPTDIADLSTGRGISYFMLGHYAPKDSSIGKADLISEARVASTKQMEYREQEKRYKKRESGVKKPVPYGADDKATENPLLSGKEWQALMDVVRTAEILISSTIPKAALTPK